MKKVKQPPLYLLAKEEIRRYIKDRGLESGAMLPPEGNLCRNLGISRGTLREAMRVLEEEDVVARKQGIGTFVINSDDLIHSTLDLNEGVSEMIRGKGMEPGSRDTVIEERPAGRKLAKKLKVSDDDMVVVVKRLRTADDIPVAYTEDFIPAAIIRGMSSDDLAVGSLYELLEQELGIELSGSILRLKPVKANKIMAGILSIKPGDLLMYLQQVDNNRGKSPVLYSEEHFVADRFGFVVMRRRKVKLKTPYWR